MPEHTIAENLARLQAAKTAIGNAIVAKGGTVNSGDGLEEYPADIASIETAELTSISITENGVYSSGDTEEVESSNLPIVIEADGTPLLDYLISGNMVQSGTPTPTTPIQPQECGELETSGVKAGQYKIPISSANTTTPVYLGEVPTTRKIKKLVFDGTEYWKKSGAYAGSFYLEGGAADAINREYEAFCSHVLFTTFSNYAQNKFCFNGSPINLNIWFSQFGANTTLADFKAFLAAQYANGTPVTVWYVLATSTTGIVNEPLRKIGDYADTLSMEQAGVDIQTNTSPSTTTIDIPTTLSPSLLYVKYNTLSTTSGYNHVDVNVPNTYSSSDEGKVVSNRQLIPQIAKPDTIIANNTYDTTNYNSVTVDVENSYTASDEGKVVSNGALVSQTAKPDTITTNSTYNTMLYNSVTVDVPNTYTQSDEGKVVNNGSLVAQTAKPTEITANDTYDTTMYNFVTVDVANSYTVEDEGKVVSNGGLVAQTAKPDVIVENGAYDTTLYNSVNVYVSPELQIPNDVNFYDYDGTIVKSYTADEFANISELPDNPYHVGLTSQGWNWSLADAKAYVAKYGKLEIGQMYITDDGKTRIYITLSEERTSPILRLYLHSNSEVDIDWGDGSSHSTFTTMGEDFRSEQHEYLDGGDYVIAITAIRGKFDLKGSNGGLNSVIYGGFESKYSPDIYYFATINKIEIGSDVVSLQGFAYCYSLKSVTIPNSVTRIGISAFERCYSLKSITIPNSVTEIKNIAFSLCTALTSISLSKTFTINNVDNCFSRCYSLQQITLSESVISIGENAFYECWALSSVVIPDSTTKISASAFYNCYSLESITIPNSVTEIRDSAFASCSAIASITIPESVTKISAYAFSNYYSLSLVRFEKNSVSPPIFTSTVFSNLPNDFKVLVPALYIPSYKTATNYPNPSTYNYIGYGTYAIGEALPTTTSGGYYRLTWYATIDDWINQSNPITTGNGSEVYAKETAI